MEISKSEFKTRTKIGFKLPTGFYKDTGLIRKGNDSFIFNNYHFNLYTYRSMKKNLLDDFQIFKFLYDKKIWDNDKDNSSFLIYFGLHFDENKQKLDFIITLPFIKLYDYSEYFSKENQIYSLILNKTEKIDFLSKINVNCHDFSYYDLYSKINHKDIELNLFVVRDRVAIFDLMHQLSSDINNFDKEKFFDFFKNNKMCKTEEIKKIIGNNPKELIISDSIIEIPIIEKINDHWVFYSHNYEKYKEKVDEIS